MNVNTVDVGYHVKWCAFHLVGCYLNTLMLQLMAGAERLCHIFKWVASLCHIFKWGREMKKVGNHCPRRLFHHTRAWLMLNVTLKARRRTTVSVYWSVLSVRV